MVYYFDFRNGRSLSKDREGYACADDAAAKRHALELGREIINRPSLFGSSWKSMSFDIVDAAGRRVGSVPFSL